jgi:hypothetical protein
MRGGRQAPGEGIAAVRDFSSHLENLLHLVAEVVDDLDADSAGRRFGEGAGYCRVHLLPGGFVDVGFQRAFQRLVGVLPDEIELLFYRP